MSHGHKSDDRMKEGYESERIAGFSALDRNFGGWWGGLYRQKLNTLQSVGLLVLVVFYVILFAALVINEWPRVEAPFWKKILYGYGPYALLSLPPVFFVVLLRWRMRNPNTTHTHRPQ